MTATYSIDDLAQAAGTTVRNVRSYREKGLLPEPIRDGRRNIYDDDALARLQLIVGLFDRGLTAAVIKDLLDSFEAGESVANTLGIETALLGAPGLPITETMSTTELAELFQSDDVAADIARACELGHLSPADTKDTWRVDEPRMLRIAADLVAEGMPISAVLDISAELSTHVDALAKAFDAAVWEHLVCHRIAAATEKATAELVALVARLRPIASVAVDAKLQKALDARVAERLPDILDALDLTTE